MTNTQYETAKQLFAEGLSLTAIGKQLKINRKKLSIQLQADGLFHGKGYSQDILLKAKDLLDDGHSYSSIGEILNIDRQAIKRALSQDVYQVKSNGWRKHTIDESRFESITTEEDAYWLGFLMADGYVYDDISYVIELGLQASDRKHIELFAEYMNSSVPIQDRDVVVDGKLYHSCRIQICSKRAVSNLVKLGCTQAKSLTLKFPEIPSELIHHFIRGYFDGDGTLYHRKDNQIEFGILGTKEFLEELRLILHNELNFFKDNQYQFHGKAYGIRYAGNNLARLFSDYIYKDATIWLKRKRNVFSAVLGQNY